MTSFKDRSKRIIIFSIYIILIDQISKLIVLNTIDIDSSKIFISNLINITLVKNTGAAFSLFSNSTWLLTCISIIATLILITIIFAFPPKSYWNSIGLTYLLGGTVGNGIDRLFRGYVLDFIEIVPIDFPIFNIADISINLAIIFFIIDIIKTKNKSKYTINNNH
tara:strand:- start:568 stop:1062 length:495 start_codon:yes stop_codon:yes gene_type:complete